MPIEFGEPQNAQFYIEKDGEFIPLGHISDVELTSDTDNAEQSELIKRLYSTEPIEIKCTFKNADGVSYFLKKGNDLYMRFPKKLRRKHKKKWMF